MAVWRMGGNPFEARELEFLVGLSRQATIALQNARLFNETKEALERQTAMAAVLRVLGTSMTDTQPVFDAIISNCSNLFRGSRVVLFLTEAEQFRAHASNGTLTGKARPINRESAVGACIADMRMIHLPDLEQGAEQYPSVRQMGLKDGFLSGLYAPLLRGGQAIGALVVLRREMGAFDDRDISLLGTFTDQAVIAIENVRLFNETQEALERQTATAEVLQVISSSVEDTPAGVRKDPRQLRESCSVLQHLGIVVVHDDGMVHPAAIRGSIVQTMTRYVCRCRWRRAPPGERCVNAASCRSATHRTHAAIQRVGARNASSRSATFRRHGVPMLRDDRGDRIDHGGAPASESLLRQGRGRLLRTFADQAVIAIENVRLFNETKEALERQTATADILRVISGSVTDTRPVFDAIVQSCRKLFAGRAVAVVMPRGDMIESVALCERQPGR